MQIGLDIGGTKIEAILLTADGKVQTRRRCPSVRDDYSGTIEAICGLVAALESEAGAKCSIGAGMPGTFSRETGLVKNANSTWLIGKPFQDDLSRALGRPLAISNDANCFALSEATDGAAKGAGIVFGVIIGTGVGGGLVINGQVIDGPNGITGEWGHNPLPWPRDDERPGNRCYCGKDGCIETFLSGPGLSRHTEAATGRVLEATEIAQLATEGDTECQRQLEIYEDRMARGLAHVINIIDPDVIVLGGGLSNIDRLYENVPDLLPGYVFSDSVRTRIVAPKYGDSSGVRGAAWLGAANTP